MTGILLTVLVLIRRSLIVIMLLRRLVIRAAVTQLVFPCGIRPIGTTTSDSLHLHPIHTCPSSCHQLFPLLFLLDHSSIPLQMQHGCPNPNQERQPKSHTDGYNNRFHCLFLECRWGGPSKYRGSPHLFHACLSKDPRDELLALEEVLGGVGEGAPECEGGAPDGNEIRGSGIGCIGQSDRRRRGRGK